MRATISSMALAAAFLLGSHAQAKAQQTSVCEDQRGYTYNAPDGCNGEDKLLDSYRTVRSNARPDECQSGCVISRFLEGNIVTEYGGGVSEQCSTIFEISPPWRLLADFVLDEVTDRVGLLFSDVGTPRARESVFFAVTDESESATVTYRFTDLLSMASPDECHVEATVRRRTLR